MSGKKPLEPAVDELLLRMSVLNGLLFLLEGQLTNFSQMFEASLKRSAINIEQIWGGAALTIRNLTEWPEHGWAVHYPAGKFTAKGKEYLDLVHTFVEREAAWTVAQGYEAFETFLKDLIAATFYHHPETVDHQKLKKFESRKKKASSTSGSQSHWKEFLAFSYKKNTELLAIIRKLAKDIVEAETRNNRAINLNDWYIIVSEVRHAVTHSNLVIATERMQPWPPTMKKLLRRLFPGTNIDPGYALKLTRQDAELALSLFGEYAFAIFKALSQSLGYDWGLPGKRTN